MYVASMTFWLFAAFADFADSADTSDADASDADTVIQVILMLMQVMLMLHEVDTEIQFYTSSQGISRNECTHPWIGHTPGWGEGAQDGGDQVEGANEQGARLQGAAAKSHDRQIWKFK